MRREAFTLIELLVVMAILATLAAMLMPILGIAKRSSDRSATTAVMHKLDTAARLFRNDIGGYPWQRSYADIDGGEAWTNRLGYQLGQHIDTLVDLPNVRQDADDAALKYRYECTVSGVTVTEPSAAVLGTFAFRRADIQRTWWWDGSAWQDKSDNTSTSNNILVNPNERYARSAVLNRMAAELARVEVFAGNPEVKGLRLDDIRSPTGTLISTGRDNSATSLLTAPASAAKPGFADDYLLGEVEKRYRNGDTMLDAWGMPLILVSQVHEGARFARTYLFRSVIYSCDLRKYSLHRRGRTVLAEVDPLTGAALPANPPALPDPAKPRSSDRRSYAAPGFEVDFELWSAGPDRQFAWMRDDARNRDNVPLSAYDKALP